ALRAHLPEDGPDELLAVPVAVVRRRVDQVHARLERGPERLLVRGHAVVHAVAPEAHGRHGPPGPAQRARGFESHSAAGRASSSEAPGARTKATSPTFVPVAPGENVSPRAWKSGPVSFSTRAFSGSRPRASARSSVVSSTNAPAASASWSTPSVPAT